MVVSPPAIPGLGATGGFSFILEQKTGGGNIKEFEGVIQNFVAEANKRPEIGRAFSFFTAQTPGYQVDVDREKGEEVGRISIGCVFHDVFVHGQPVMSMTLPAMAAISE